MSPVTRPDQHRTRTISVRAAVLACAALVFAPVACGDDGGATNGNAAGTSGSSNHGGDSNGGGAEAGDAGLPRGGSSAAQGGSEVATGGLVNGGGSNSGEPAGGAGAAPSGGMTAAAGMTAVAGSPEGGGAGAPGSGMGGSPDTAGNGGANSAAGAGGQPPVCADVLASPGCADANAQTEDGQSAVFGGCMHINQVSPGVGWIQYQSFGVDISSGLAFANLVNIKAHDDLVKACADLSVQGISGWRLATIDEARLLAGGCAPTAPGGSCPITDPDCLSASCGFDADKCQSCVGGQGPHSSKGYCRPEVSFCVNLPTSSECKDCPTPGYWTYSIINGNFYSASPASTMFEICVKSAVPGAIPCELTP